MCLVLTFQSASTYRDLHDFGNVREGLTPKANYSNLPSNTLQTTVSLVYNVKMCKDPQNQNGSKAKDG